MQVPVQMQRQQQPSERLAHLSERAWWAAAEAAWAMAQLERSTNDLELLERRGFAHTQRRATQRCLDVWRAAADARLRLLPAATSLIILLSEADRRAKLIAAAGGAQIIGLRPLSSAFGYWARAASLHRRVARLAVMRLLRGQHGRAFRCWRRALERQRWQLGLVRRGFLHMRHRAMAQGFVSWAMLLSDVRRQRERQAFLVTCVRHMRHWKLGRGWRSWRGRRLERTALVRKLKAGVARWASREISKGFQTWAWEAFGTLKLARFATRLVSRQLSRSYRTWALRTSEGARNWRMLSRAGSHLLHSDLARAWLGWYNFHIGSAASRRALRRSVSHLMRRGLSLGLNTWRTYALEVVHKRRALAFFVHAGTCRALASWGEAAAARSLALSRLRRSLGHISYHEIAKGWRRWLECSRANSRYHALLSRSIGGFRHTASARAWREWRSRMYEASILRDATSFWLQVALAKGMRTWLDGRSSRKMALSMLQRAVAHLMHRQLANGFKQWQFAFDDASLYASGPLRVASRFAADHRLVRAWGSWVFVARSLVAFESWARKVANRDLLRGWLSWFDAHAQATTRLVRLRRGVAHLVCRRISRGWHAWVDRADEGAYTRSLAERALSRLLLRSLGRGWNAWAAMCAVDAEGATRKASSFFRGRAYWRGWSTWRDFAERRAWMMSLLLKGVSWMISAGLARGWATWAGWVTARHAWLATARRGMAAILYRRILLAFRGLLANLHAARRAQNALDAMTPEGRAKRWAWAVLRRGGLLRHGMRVAASRLCRRGAVQAIGVWSHAVRQRQRLGAFVGRICHAELLRLLNGWREAVDTRLLAARVVGMARGCGLGRGLNGWRSAAAEAHEALACVETATRRWRGSARVGCWQVWRSEAKRLGEERRKGRRCLLRIAARRLVGALGVWAAQTASRRALRWAASGFVSPALRLSFRSWTHAALELAAVRARALRAAAYFRAGPGLGKAVRTWATSTRAAAARQEAQRAVILRLQEKGLARAWESWQFWSEALAERLRLLKQGAAGVLTPALRRSLLHWRSCAQLVRTSRRALLRLANRKLGLGWSSWLRWRAERLEDLRRRRRAMGHMLHPELRRGLSAWLETTHAARVLAGSAMGRACARWADRKRSVAWSTWYDLSLERRQRLRSVASIANSGLRRCLNSWRDAGAKGARLLALQRQGIARASQLAEWRAFNGWTDFADMRRHHLGLISHGAWAFVQRRFRLAVNAWKGRAFDEPQLMAWALAAWVGGALTKGWRVWLDQVVQKAARVREHQTRALAFFCRFGEVRAWRRWQARINENGFTRAQRRALEAAFAPVCKMRNARLLREAVAVWTKGLWEYGVAGARRALLRDWRQQAVASCARNGVLRLLRPAERREWPSAWHDFFGWKLTWREVPWWLGSLGITVPHSQAVLISTLRAGHIYLQLIDRITAAPHECVDGSCAHAGRAGRPSFWAAAAAERGERGWRGVVADFLHSRHATSVLGERHCQQLSDVCREPFQPQGLAAQLKEYPLSSAGTLEAAHHPAAHEEGGKAVEHLALLRAFRVLLEVESPDLWARFIGSLAGPNPSDARPPRFTTRHDGDDYSRCEPLAPGGANYVCLGCPTPRILLHNQKCGACELHAVTSTEEYLATFANGLEQKRKRDEIKQQHATQQLAQAKLHKMQQLQLFDRTRAAPLSVPTTPSSTGSPRGFGSATRSFGSSPYASALDRRRTYLLSPNGLPVAERPSSAGKWDDRSRILYNGYEVRPPPPAPRTHSPSRGKKLSAFAFAR